MGAIAFIGITLLSITKSATLPQIFSGFSNPVIWLVVSAFFLSRGFIKTNLGLRIAFVFIKYLGKTSLGVVYALGFADLLLAPAIPSNTARIGGIIYPIAKSVANAYGSEPGSSQGKIGTFLILCIFQMGMITSAMFLTSMAGNPLIMDLAGSINIPITWGKWALAASFPGILSLLCIPLLIYFIQPPQIKRTPDAFSLASSKLAEMGKISRNELILIGVFLLLLFLWIFGDVIGINPTTAAILGISLLLLFSVLDWKDIIQDSSAFDTLIWFASLLAMARILNEYGLIDSFSNYLATHIPHFNWGIGLLSICAIYYFSHYFFASNIAHISAMYQPLLLIAVSFGAPPLVSALILGFLSSLYGGLTHYGCGPAPILFGSGYVEIKNWWGWGFVFAILNIAIWLGIGYFWWSWIGLF